MDVTRIHHALIIVIGVGLAALFLVFEWPAIAAGALVVVIALLSEWPILAKVRSLLPDRPEPAQRWLDWLWVSRVVPFGLLAAIPIWLGAELGDQFGTDLGKRAAAQVVGVAVAYATVELAKAMDQDGKVVDDWIGRRSEDLLTRSMVPQFDDQEPPGPLPKFERNPQGEIVPSELWLTINDTNNTGWERGVRRARARRIQELLNERPGAD